MRNWNDSITTCRSPEIQLIGEESGIFPLELRIWEAVLVFSLQRVTALSIPLDHRIVPARHRRAAAELLAALLDVPWAESGVGPFCPVYVNDGLTLDFDQAEGPFPVQHFCFRVSEEVFDGIVTRIRAHGIGYRSTPHGPVDCPHLPAVSAAAEELIAAVGFRPRHAHSGRHLEPVCGELLFTKLWAGDKDHGNVISTGIG